MFACDTSFFKEVKKTYSLFETNGAGEATSSLAKWQIKVNNSDVTTLTEKNNAFVLGSIDWGNQTHVKAGKAAPGSIGSFDIFVNPFGTEVAFLYELTFDLAGLTNTEFGISSVLEVNGKELVRTGENTYTGIARLSDIQNNTIYHVQVKVAWNNNELNNEADYDLGSKANQEVYIPVKVMVRQYEGEELIVYEEG